MIGKVDKVRHMAADAVQQVVDRIVTGSSGHSALEEADDPQLLKLFQASWICQAAGVEERARGFYSLGVGGAGGAPPANQRAGLRPAKAEAGPG